jgi:hypothetical protein
LTVQADGVIIRLDNEAARVLEGRSLITGEIALAYRKARAKFHDDSFLSIHFPSLWRIANGRGVRSHIPRQNSEDSNKARTGFSCR